MLVEFGVEPEQVFAGLGFGPDDMLTENRIPFDTALALLDRAVRLSGNPSFGLLLGARHDHKVMGVVGELMSVAPTLRRALENYIALQPAYSGGACVYLVPMGDCYALGYGIYDRHAPGADQVYALTMSLGTNMVRALSGGVAKPVETHLCYRPPIDLGPYDKLLDSRFSFNESQTCLFLPKETLDAPNPTADAASHAELSGLIAARVPLNAQSAAARLRHILRPALSLGETSLGMAAEHLGLSERSLNRKLLQEGTSFARERDLVRFRMACELLLLTDLPIWQISDALSYANHTAFIRSFRRWSGNAPADWRKAHSSQQPTLAGLRVTTLAQS